MGAHQPQETMTMNTLNGYVCFYRGQRFEVRAATPHEAQQQVAQQVQAKNRRLKVKTYDIAVALAEVGTRPVVLDGASLPGA
jgi:hypothetical protein